MSPEGLNSLQETVIPSRKCEAWRLKSRLMRRRLMARLEARAPSKTLSSSRSAQQGRGRDCASTSGSYACLYTHGKALRAHARHALSLHDLGLRAVALLVLLAAAAGTRIVAADFVVRAPLAAPGSVAGAGHARLFQFASSCGAGRLLPSRPSRSRRAAAGASIATAAGLRPERSPSARHCGAAPLGRQRRSGGRSSTCMRYR